MKTLRIENFKCFEKEEINFANLTVLAGNNGSGKSTVIQSLLLLVQSFEKNNFSLGLKRLYINDYYCELGSSKRLLYKDAKEDLIQFEYIDKHNNSTTLQCSIDQKDFNIFNINHNITNNDNPYENKSLDFITYFDFISADRFGPKIFHHTDSNFSRIKVGKFGEYSTLVLDKYKDELLDIPLPNKTGGEKFSLVTHVNYWLSEIFGFMLVDTDFIEEANVAVLKIKNHPDRDYENPVNMPYGVSYVLPIIVSCLVRQISKEKLFDNYIKHNHIDEEDELVIIENPEAHLHPAAQSTLGKFLSLMSNNIQIIVETHSDHIINGIRIAVQNKLIKYESILFNFFHLDLNSAFSSKQEIKIDEKGALSNWPKGFFDQYEKDLLDLM